MEKDSDGASKGVGCDCRYVSTCVEDISFLVAEEDHLFLSWWTGIVPLLILVIPLIWK